MEAATIARRTFLPGDDAVWVEEQRRDLGELLVRALECLADASLAAGEGREAVRQAEELTALEPYREGGYRRLMQAHAAAGDSAEALRVYERCRRLLADELGAYPSPETEAIYRDLLRAPATGSGVAPETIASAAEHPPELARDDEARSAKARRAHRVLAAIGAALLLAVTAASVAAFTGDDAETVSAAGALALAPESGEVLGRVALGTAPSRVAIGDGSVWVTDADDRTVSRIDPETRTATRTFSTSTTPTDIAAGAGAIWVGNAPIGAESGAAEDWLPASVSRLDPESGRVVATIELRAAPGGNVDGVLPGVSVQHLAAAPDAVWVINRDLTVSRIDPRSDRIVATIEGVKARNIAVGDGEVWIAEENVVAEIDPGTNSIARRLTLEAPFLSTLAVGGGAVWVTDPEQGNVWRIDTRGKLEGTAIPLETWVAGLSFGEGAVWVTNEIADAVHRIDPRTNTVRRIGRATSPRGVDAADGAVWVTSASPPSRDAALPASVCSDVHFDRAGTPDLVISSSLPLQGPERAVTRSMVDAIERVLADRRFEAGAFSVGYQSCDSSTAQSGSEDFFRCGSNAKALARKLNVVGVVGSYFSFCSYLQIPLLNAAPGGPVALISPSNTYEGLTDDDGLYPSGARSFFRLAAYRYQGAAQVELARQLGHERLFLLTSSGDEYGAPYLERLRAYAKRVDVEIVGTARFDAEAETFVGIAREVARSRPQSVALVGLLTPATGTLIRELRAALRPGVALSGPDAFALPKDLRKLAGAAAEGMYVTTYGIPNDRLPPQGKAFLTSFAAERGGDRGPDLAASYGAQAAEILLNAIARSDGTRASVTNEMRSTDVRNGILGDISFDPKGDLVDEPFTVLRAAGGELVVDRVVVVRPGTATR